jgi:hypothetical protein
MDTALVLINLAGGDAVADLEILDKRSWEKTLGLARCCGR